MTGTRKMVVEIDADLFKALKMKAAETECTLRSLVIAALQQILEQKGGTHD